jgi:DNA-binding MarR family transcriptional regulator
MRLIGEFLDSTRIFVLALGDILETRTLEEIRAGQVTPAQMRVVKLIAQSGADSVAGVAEYLGIGKAAAGKAVERLVGRKLVQRARSDSRSSLELSAAGRSLLTRFEAARARRLSAVFHRLPAADLKRAAAVLDHLAAGVVTGSAAPEEICRQCGIYFKERCLLQEVVRRHCAAGQRRPKRKREGTTQ